MNEYTEIPKFSFTATEWIIFIAIPLCLVGYCAYPSVYRQVQEYIASDLLHKYQVAVTEKESVEKRFTDLQNAFSETKTEIGAVPTEQENTVVGEKTAIKENDVAITAPQDLQMKLTETERKLVSERNAHENTKQELSQTKEKLMTAVKELESKPLSGDDNEKERIRKELEDVKEELNKIITDRDEKFKQLNQRIEELSRGTVVQ